MSCPFMAYVVTDRDDPYVNGGRVLRVYAEEADAWDFVAERTALRAERRAREDQGRGDGAIPLPEWRHHAPSEEHVRECPNPECQARRAA